MPGPRHTEKQAAEAPESCLCGVEALTKRRLPRLWQRWKGNCAHADVAEVLQIVNGSAGAWEDFPKVCPGDYTVRWGGGAILTVRKQYIGNFTLKSGGMVSWPPHPDAGIEDGADHASIGPRPGGMALMHASAACADAGCVT